MFGRANQSRLFDTEHGRIFEESLLVLRRVLLHRDAIAGGVANDLVVYVGNVHDMLDLVTALPQKSAKKIDGDKGAEVADVSVVVDGRSASVHADLGVAERAELLDLRRHRIKKAKGHISWVTRRT